MPDTNRIYNTIYTDGPISIFQIQRRCGGKRKDLKREILSMLSKGEICHAGKRETGIGNELLLYRVVDMADNGM